MSSRFEHYRIAREAWQPNRAGYQASVRSWWLFKSLKPASPRVICTPVMLAAARSRPGSHNDIAEAGQLGRVPALELQDTSMPITMTAILICSRKATPAGGAPD